MRSIRKESKTSSYNNTDPLFKQRELLNLSDLVTLNKLKFHYNYSDMLLPEYFNITNQAAHHKQNFAYSYQVQSIPFHKICNPQCKGILVGHQYFSSELARTVL